jgi:hypothetical protein
MIKEGNGMKEKENDMDLIWVTAKTTLFLVCLFFPVTLIFSLLGFSLTPTAETIFKALLYAGMFVIPLSIFLFFFSLIFKLFRKV